MFEAREETKRKSRKGAGIDGIEQRCSFAMGLVLGGDRSKTVGNDSSNDNMRARTHDPPSSDRQPYTEMMKREEIQ